MKVVFLFFLAELSNFSGNRFKAAWKLAKLDGKKTVTFTDANGKMQVRQTTGDMKHYVTKDKAAVVVVYQDETVGATRSFRLDRAVVA